MYRSKDLDKYLNIIYAYSDKAEIYYEENLSKNYIYVSSNLKGIDTSYTNGFGIRLINDEDFYLSSTENINEEINKISKYFKKENKEELKFNEIEHLEDEGIITSTSDIKNFFNMMDKIIRSYSNLISQVDIRLSITRKTKTIINTNMNKKRYKTYKTRLMIETVAEKNNKKVNTYKTFGKTGGFELLSSYDFPKIAEEIAKVTVEKLDAIPFEGGNLPVVINKGFGAVIIHESAGHALEAESIRRGLSIFKDDLNKKVASPLVTLVDDASLPKLFGSSLIDDEGEKARENVLIKEGILQNFLLDSYNGSKINMKTNASSRRESFLYRPTSRMSNTYLQNGDSKPEDIIKTIKYGLYLKEMGGGSVDPSTGNFNFYSTLPYLIENGKVTKLLEGVSVIGNSKEILSKISMVGNDLTFETGYCGASSGMIPVTIGQPTIKVDSILIGGSK